MNLSDFLQRKLATCFDGRTVSLPKGANAVSKRIDNLNKQVSQCSCEIVTRQGSFEFDGASMDKTPNPFTKEKPLLKTKASNNSLFFRSLSTELMLEVKL